ncbi:hypothetical protein D3C78_804310 [compost metagenome]
MLPEIPPQKVEAFGDVREPRFLAGQRNPSYRQELLHPRFDLFLQQLFRSRQNHEVVRVAHTFHLGFLGSGIAQLVRQMVFQLGFQTVQGGIGQTGRDDPALWRPGLRGRELLFVDDSGLQPFTQYRFVHGDVLAQPFVVDVVEEPLDVALQHPDRRRFPRQ